jgi:ankyrin repeat protein
MLKSLSQEDIVSWLCEEMVRADLSVDQMDSCGNSPLLLAAKHGRMAAAAVLLRHGAHIGLKNSMGLRAYDCARLSRKKGAAGADCAEYLLLFETSLDVSTQLLRSRALKEGLRGENEELKTYFK